MLRKLFTLKYWLLRHPSLWKIDKDIPWNIEMDYLKRPRQFFKHRIYTEYRITSIYLSKPYTKEEAVDMFMDIYYKDELYKGRLAVIQNNSNDSKYCPFCIMYCIRPSNCRKNKSK